jgi:anti-anti-sigma factor
MTCEPNIALVPVSGDLSMQTAPALKRTIESLVDEGVRRIVINMAEVPYVDSTGMSALFCAVRLMRERGGLLSLINVTPNVMRTLKIARFVDLVPVSATEERREVPELDPSVQPLWYTTFPVDATNLQDAREYIERQARSMPFSNDAVFDLILAAGEAMGNAADHTCGQGILATVCGYPDRMVIEVADCGEGFDPVAVDPDDCLACDERGRGIRLMRLLVDSVSIAPRQMGSGMVVRLEKLIG